MKHWIQLILSINEARVMRDVLLELRISVTDVTVADTCAKYALELATAVREFKGDVTLLLVSVHDARTMRDVLMESARDTKTELVKDVCTKFALKIDTSIPREGKAS